MRKILDFKTLDYYLIAGIVFLALWAQNFIFFNYDTYWHVLAAERIFAGHAAYHVNLLDDNLPMVFWFFIPPVWLHQQTSFNLILLCNLWVALILLITFFLSHIFLSAIYKDQPRWQLQIVRYTLLFLLFIFPCWEYGQRDVLVVALLLPYITLMGQKVTALKKASSYLTGLVGLCALTAITMNPFYALTVILLECQYFFYKKKITFFRVETGVMALGFIGYLAILHIFYPSYFTVIIPAFYTYCAQLNSSLTQILLSLPSLFFYMSTCAFGVYFFLRRGPWALCLWLTTLTGWSVFVIHLKIWDSHTCFMYTANALLLIVMLVDLLQDKKQRFSVLTILTLILLSIFAYIFYTYRTVSHALFFDQKNELNQLKIFLQKQPKNTSLYFFSYIHTTFFSVLPYAELTYLPAGPNNWLMFDVPTASKTLQKQQDIQFEKIVRDFETQQPQLVVINTSEDNQKYLSHFMTRLHHDPRFQQAWGQYRLVKKTENYAVYIKTAQSLHPSATAYPPHKPHAISTRLFPLKQSP